MQTRIRNELHRMEAADRAQKKREEAVAGRESINIPLREIPRKFSGKIPLVALGEWTGPELVMLTDNARLVALIGIQDITNKLCQVQVIRKKHADQKWAEEATALNESMNLFYCKVGVFVFIFFGCIIYAATSDWSEGVSGNAVGFASAMIPLLLLLLLAYFKCRAGSLREKNNEKIRQKNFSNRSLKIAVEALFTAWVQKGVNVGFTSNNAATGDLMTVWLPRLSGDGGIPTAEVAIAMPVSEVVNQNTNVTSWEPPAPSVPSAPPPQSDSTKSAAGRLSEAKALLEAGLITDEMFAEKQKSILESL